MSPLEKLSLSSLWALMREEAEAHKNDDPALANVVAAGILAHENFTSSLLHVLVGKLHGSDFSASEMKKVFEEVHVANPALSLSAQKDLIAVRERDPAAASVIAPFLFFKGFHALQAHRIAHQLWRDGRNFLALLLQSMVSERFGVDIHPAAKIGQGVMMDHATGIVIGETAEIGDNVSLLHAVTLGGTGNERGDRHPKIGSGVMIGAGAKILGNIKVGNCARVAAGSVVLENVPPNVTVAGVPSRIIGKAGCEQPAAEMDQLLPADCISI